MTDASNVLVWNYKTVWRVAQQLYIWHLDYMVVILLQALHLLGERMQESNRASTARRPAQPPEQHVLDRFGQVGTRAANTLWPPQHTAAVWAGEVTEATRSVQQKDEGCLGSIVPPLWLPRAGAAGGGKENNLTVHPTPQSSTSHLSYGKIHQRLSECGRQQP